jgi:hypothetical protein
LIASVHERVRLAVTRRLPPDAFPEAHAGLLLSLAGIGAFLVSAALLRAGVTSMPLRYLAATAIGYLLFLALVRGWILYQGPRWASAELPADSGADAGQPSGFWDFWDLSYFDGRGMALSVLLAALVAVAVVIEAAPVLLAEALLDAAVVGAVFPSLRYHGRSFWLRGAVRRTWVAAIVLCLSLAAVGLALQSLAPDAHSLGDVVIRSP